jgi:hypothetical protein
MAVLVDIKRLSESEKHADYSFTVAEASAPGILRIDKDTGAVSLVRHMLGTPSEAHFHRAAHKIREHWARGRLPETAVSAS